MQKPHRFEQLALLPYLGKWLLIASAVAALAGSASAFFLIALDQATNWRETHPWVIWLLPFAGLLVGLVGMLFATATHKLGALVKRSIAYAPLRPLLGGVVIAGAVFALDAHQYIGLGIGDIVRSFQEPMQPWDFFGKLVFTVASLGTGFKGGEVTPLFYIGATLGNALAPVLHMPFAFMAGIGFVAVFAGAANTPVATTLMAMELFGADIGPWAAIGCVTAYLFSGHAGIYQAQRVGHAKLERRSADSV